MNRLEAFDSFSHRGILLGRRDFRSFLLVMSLSSRFLFVPAWALVFTLPAQAQSRFTLRAEPDVIPAGGIATTSIFVQVPQRSAISQNGVVRFATTSGVIESQAQLSGGVARVLLRSANTAGTAVVTAFVGNSREAITVEFAETTGVAERFLQVSAPYTAYGQTDNQITTAGRSVLEFGDLRIESDVRLDVDLYSERVWAQGNKGGVKIQHGRGEKAKVLVGDRLFYDLRRKKGVVRRAEGDLTNSPSGARQEFVGSQFSAPPPGADLDGEVDTQAAETRKNSERESPILPAAQNPNRASGAPLEARDGITVASDEGRDADSKSNSAQIATGEQNHSASPGDALGIGLPQVESPSLKDSKDSENQPLTPTAGGKNLAPETVTPGSLADKPSGMASEGRIVASPLVSQPRPEAVTGETLPEIAPYTDLETAKIGYTPAIVELPAPNFDAVRGYWVTARRLRVFPRDEVQFERAKVYFNGKKAFSAPVYAIPLDGSFNPTTDMFAFNSSGGLGVKIPVYYQANKAGTGSITFRNEPGKGFGTLQSGPSLEVKHQYWLSSRSQGEVGVDSIGNGPWNLTASHRLEIDRKTSANIYLNMPRHRDLFARASLTHDLAAAQIGIEAFFDRPETQNDNLRGQFFARMRPRNIGRSGWTTTLGFNALAVKNVASTRLITVGGGGIGGGVGVPGQGNTPTTRLETTYRPLFGQQLTAGLQSPIYSPLPGSTLSANVFATAFNYSDNRRGAAPGLTLSFGQRLGRSADLRLDYTYDRSNLGLYGARSDSFTHYASASFGVQVTNNIGFSSFLSRSLNDGSLYGNADLSVAFAKNWRAGIFSDYSTFGSEGKSFNYGISLGRSIANREVSVNWDAVRGKIYLEIGSARY